LGKSRSRNKVFVEEKKDRKEKQLQVRITELERENAKLRREIESLLAQGKVPVVKETKAATRKVVGPPKAEDIEKAKQEARDKVKAWRIATFGDYNEE
jgi:hypothetical protein